MRSGNGSSNGSSNGTGRGSSSISGVSSVTPALVTLFSNSMVSWHITSHPLSVVVSYCLIKYDTDDMP